MIRKTMIHSQTEAWSIGLSWSHHLVRTSSITCSRNWNSNQDFAWANQSNGCWSRASPRSKYIFNSIPRSWSQWI